MKLTSLTFKILALIGLLIFITVQFFLIYNTYQINEERFFSKERELIDAAYSKSIINDRVYPGGQGIIDTILNNNKDSLEKLYYKNKKAFHQLSHHVIDTIFHNLNRRNNMDSILDNILRVKYNISSKYKYALVVNKFDISFRNNQYIPLFPFSHNDSIYHRVGGSLSQLNPTNRITSLTVSSIEPKSIRIGFQLYLETSNKTWGILKRMMPMFLLSIASIITIATLFAFTTNNWLKQKKLAEMQTDFINSISHEFNTPLTAIIIANKTLQNEKLIPPTETIKSLTSIIQRQTTRLNGLFQQTLRITKADQSFINKQEENIHQLISKIIADYKTHTNDNTTINFTSKISETKLVNVDIFWFTTMLQNIMDNGLKYNNNVEKHIDITLSAHYEDIILKIKDNGIGMTAHTIKKIFNKFYRHNPKDSRAGGLGLGLFYVQECIYLHGWKIKVESIVGKGSEFIVHLR